MDWSLKTFGDLAAGEMYDMLRLRVDVFVVEQECPYPEIDGYDRESLHMFGMDGDVIAAYARILPPGVKYDDPSIGRVIIREEYRGRGMARELVLRAKEAAREKFGEIPVFLQGQQHLEGFYTSCGFSTISEPYDEDGIPHIDMRSGVSAG